MGNEKKKMMKLWFDDNNVAHEYDDTYDLTIHCETAEELEHAKKLLQRGMRWIPVTERMPEEHETWIKVAGRNTKSSGRLLITVEGDDGGRSVVVGGTRDGRWKAEFYVEYVHVVAWMPFPEPYEGV